MPNKTTDFAPRGLATLIGSLPVAGYDEAIEWILRYTPEIPLWPQLPSNPLEGMMNQFIEGLPGVIENDGKTWFNLEVDGFAEAQLAFFEAYLSVSEDLSQLPASRFAVSRERANGIYALKEACLAAERKPTAVKAQITGPFTLLTGLCDQDQRLGYYSETFREMAVRELAMKAAWQVEFLKEIGAPVIVFIDEPALAGLGSVAYISIAKDDIAADLNEVIAATHQAGGLAGIHVCANTEWPFVLSLDLDILSFDAYGYFDRLVTCRDDVLSFLDRGGIIAWGIVPTSDIAAIESETGESLAKKWEAQAELLETDGWDKRKLLEKTLVTPSCGTGAISAEHARKVLELTKDVSEILRNKYFQGTTSNE